MDQPEINNVKDLKHGDYNPRMISDFDKKNLKNSITTFGDLSGIVRNRRTGNLVGGNQRTDQFVALGNPPIEITEKLEKANSVGTVARGYVILGDEKYTYREVEWELHFEESANIAANRIAGEWDIKKLGLLTKQLQEFDPDLVKLSGQSDQEVSSLIDMINKENAGPDEAVPALDDKNPPVSKTGEVYQLGRHRLMCGDATSLDDVQKLMDGKQADMVFTDPPYNVAYEGKTDDKLTIQNDSFKDGAAFYDFLYLAFSNLNAATKPGSAIYICHADSEGLNFRKAMVESGWLIKQCIIWNKNQMVMGRQDYQWKHEPILYGWKEGASHYFVKDRNLTTVWDIDKPSASAEHPTMKPIKLVQTALLNSSMREAYVLDTFGGSGSTLIACEEIDRICYTMELDPKYCDVIRKRYAAAQKQEDWQAATPGIGLVEDEGIVAVQ